MTTNSLLRVLMVPVVIAGLHAGIAEAKAKPAKPNTSQKAAQKDEVKKDMDDKFDDILLKPDAYKKFKDFYELQTKTTDYSKVRVKGNAGIECLTYNATDKDVRLGGSGIKLNIPLKIILNCLKNKNGGKPYIDVPIGIEAYNGGMSYKTSRIADFNILNNEEAIGLGYILDSGLYASFGLNKVCNQANVNVNGFGLASSNILCDHQENYSGPIFKIGGTIKNDSEKISLDFRYKDMSTGSIEDKLPSGLNSQNIAIGYGIELKAGYENSDIDYNGKIGQEIYGISSTADLTKNTYLEMNFLKKFGKWFKTGFGVRKITTEKPESKYLNEQLNVGLKAEATF